MSDLNNEEAKDNNNDGNRVNNEDNIVKEGDTNINNKIEIEAKEDIKNNNDEPNIDNNNQEIEQKDKSQPENPNPILQNELNQEESNSNNIVQNSPHPQKISFDEEELNIKFQPQSQTQNSNGLPEKSLKSESTNSNQKDNRSLSGAFSISSAHRKSSNFKYNEPKLFEHTKKNKLMDINSFYKQKRHYFIMTEGGTPIYSRYGDEMKNCSILATFSAIITKFTIFNADSNFVEKLNYISNEKSTIVFLKKGKIMFIALSNKKDSISFLYSQLELLYSLLLSVITSERIPKIEEKPSTCQSLLQDTEQLFEQMIEYTSNSMVSVLSAFQVLSVEDRNKINEICYNYLGEALLCFLITPDATAIIALAKTNLIVLSQVDIILIQNLIMHSESLRTTESWVPICLPGISAEGFVQLYCNFAICEHFGIVYVTENQEYSLFATFCNNSEKIVNDIKDNELMGNIIRAYQVSNYNVEGEDTGGNCGSNNNDGNASNVNNVNNAKKEDYSVDDFIKVIFNKKEDFFNNYLNNKNLSSNEDAAFLEKRAIALGINIEKDNEDTRKKATPNASKQNDLSSKDNSDSKNKKLQDNTSSNLQMEQKLSFGNSVYKIKDGKRDLFLNVKYAIFKHKILNQFFNVNFNPPDKTTKEELKIYKIYGKLYDMYNSQDDKLINLNNFFHFEKDNNYSHVLYANENYILIASFSLFKPSDVIHFICKEIFKLVKNYEHSFFINLNK